MTRRVPLTTKPVPNGLVITASNYSLTFYDMQYIRAVLKEVPLVVSVQRLEDNKALVYAPLRQYAALAAIVKANLTIYARLSVDVRVAADADHQRVYDLTISSRYSKEAADLAGLAPSIVGDIKTWNKTQATLLAAKDGYVRLMVAGPYALSWRDGLSMLPNAPLHVVELRSAGKNEDD